MVFSWNKPDVQNKRRLLIFSDSRQDAAYFATYFENSYNQILQRRLIVNTLEKYQEKVITNQWRLRDLAEYVKRLLIDLGLYPKLEWPRVRKRGLEMGVIRIHGY